MRGIAFALVAVTFAATTPGPAAAQCFGPECDRQRPNAPGNFNERPDFRSAPPEQGQPYRGAPYQQGQPFQQGQQYRPAPYEQPQSYRQAPYEQAQPYRPGPQEQGQPYRPGPNEQVQTYRGAPPPQGRRARPIPNEQVQQYRPEQYPQQGQRSRPAPYEQAQPYQQAPQYQQVPQYQQTYQQPAYQGQRPPSGYPEVPPGVAPRVQDYRSAGPDGGVHVRTTVTRITKGKGTKSAARKPQPAPGARPVVRSAAPAAAGPGQVTISVAEYRELQNQARELQRMLGTRGGAPRGMAPSAPRGMPPGAPPNGASPFPDVPPPGAGKPPAQP